MLRVLLAHALTLPAAAALLYAPTAPIRRPPSSPIRQSAPVASESLAVTKTKAGIGLAAQPVVWWSLGTLASTGCGLDADSTVQALEGLAYTVVAGFALSGLATRLRTGEGLQAAELLAADAEAAALATATEERRRFSAAKVAAVPDVARVLGLAESLSYITVVAGLVVGAVQIAEYGSLPSAVPAAGSACWSPR